MKEPSDDIITKKIKEVLEQYEPDYSPQLWEKISKQRPMPELWLITILQKYKIGLSILTITGVLFIVNITTDIRPADKNSVVNPASPESFNNPVPGKAIDIVSSEKTSVSGNSISNNAIGQEEKIITPEVSPVLTAGTLTAADHSYIPAENTIAERYIGIEKTSGIYVLPIGADFAVYSMTKKLLPAKYPTEGNHLLKSQADHKIGELEFHWPDFKSLVTEDEDYDKFAGPNKLSFFYSPEIHFSDSLKTVGLSQGIGISYEGPVRSLVSVSAGLSYQSVHYDDKAVFSEKVPPDLVLEPADTNSTFYMVDSIGIRSGSYRFLELPVSLNFKFLETTRSQVWFGSGISSIAFLRQEYTYESLVEGISESSSSISVKAWKNIHPLASLNFSLFYRYSYSDRFLMHGSIQYKQHLCGLGYNSMKLDRLNLQLGVVFRFGREDR